jgi:hypothetical protein
VLLPLPKLGHVFPKMVNTVQQYIDTPPTVRVFNVESSQTFRIAEGKAA